MSQTSLFKPKRSLGQNFLIDQNIARKIIDSSGFKETESVLEIGPGKGALTDAIAPKVKSLIAVEKDHILAKELAMRFEHTNVSVVEKDFLTFDINKLPENMKVIGNLPYNAATPIIEKIITNPKHFHSFYLTVQLEYGERIVGKPGSKTFGPLTCFIEYHAVAKKLFNIKNTAFYPRPKVHSCFLSLEIRKEPRYKVSNERKFFNFIKQAFGQRRKTLANALSDKFGKENAIQVLAQLGIQSNIRAEDLSLEELTKIFSILST